MSLDPVFPPLIVYHNIEKMLQYRDYELHSKISDEDFISRFNTHGYAVITGVRDASAIRDESSIACVLVQEDSEYTNKSESFGKLILGQRNLLTHRKTNIEIVVIGGVITSHIYKKITNMNKEYAGTVIEFHTQDIFKCEVPAHKMQPVFEIVRADDEIWEQFEKRGIYPSYLPIMPLNDPIAVWFGMRVGNLIRITATSGLAGSAIRYRIVC